MSRGHGRRALTAVVSAFALAAAAAGQAAAGAGRRPTLLVRQVSHDPAWASGEGWVVADPRNPRLLTASWTELPYGSPVAAVSTAPGPAPIQCGLGFSTDGGRTWVERRAPFQPVALPSDPGGCADPSIVVDARGTVYALLNGGSLLPGAGTASARPPSLVSFSMSRDSGRTWTAPAKVWSPQDAAADTLATGSPDLAFDRSWLVIDPVTSVLYASVSDDALVERVVLASHDHGRTWSSPRPLDPDGQSVWADGISAAHGTLAAAYSVDPSSWSYRASRAPAIGCGRPCAVFETSTDDGKTWRRHVVPAPTVLSTPFGSPAAPGVEVAADPNRTGHYAVLVPVAADLAQVWVTVTGGRTWRRSLDIRGGSGDTVVKPWLAFGPTGALGVVWRRLHGDKTYDVFAAVSTGSGDRFGRTLALTRRSAPPDVAPAPVGDDCACGLFLTRTSLLTTWADSRTGRRQLWFARYDLPLG